LKVLGSLWSHPNVIVILIYSQANIRGSFFFICVPTLEAEPLLSLVWADRTRKKEALNKSASAFEVAVAQTLQSMCTVMAG